MLTFTSDIEIDRIGRGVLERTLPKAEWTHAAHFAAAFWVIRRPDMDATRDMPALIRAYNEATGVRNTDTTGYHETITMASLRAARAWLRYRFDSPLYESLNELMASEYGLSSWPLAHWSKPLLFSVDARRNWVEPDLRTLPF
jgi:hypothetical protein